ncbi:MAG TPA: hypothetical protein VK917_01595, partial [Ilumatobacter sp.]|nr:hypothetical protein [Ilumatobacter sp.]
MAGTIEIVQHDAGAFTRLRARLEGAVTSAGTIHRGPRGLVAFQVKRAVVRSLYWYVEPVVARLRESISESVDVTESVAIDAASARTELSMLRCEADELRCEVDVL